MYKHVTNHPRTRVAVAAVSLAALALLASACGTSSSATPGAASTSNLTPLQYTEHVAQTVYANQGYDGEKSCKPVQRTLEFTGPSTQLNVSCSNLYVQLLKPGMTTTNWAKDVGAFCSTSYVSGTYNGQVWVAGVTRNYAAIAHILGGKVFQPC